ncbi:hypothetical protein OG689_31970 [Kitasatospora sp. NBC_00240]|uniref:hypothetical protein n=1 Tax=Kitasatospora sp. NBC_00240 TaxID=2903567 RepID=UPI0022588735|nr:hypothetical protein [Kitasatospora sp. NBC_00240]MCX5213835.1 hypothetical protein [Kitasatospora sp. NBC_00240]
MASFLTHRALVLDEALPPHRRHSALRTCLTLFAPYGLRPTYHHLTLSARIPRELAADPGSLVRAMAELHEARLLWLAATEGYVRRRRAEKRAGRRRGPDDPWQLVRRGQTCFQTDVCCHPAMSLSAYVRRRIAVLEGRQLPGCHRCGDERPVVSYSTGHGFVDICRGCGTVLKSCGCGTGHRLEPPERYQWPGIWRREHMTDEGLPAPGAPRGAEGRAERLRLWTPADRPGPPPPEGPPVRPRPAR